MTPTTSSSPSWRTARCSPGTTTPALQGLLNKGLALANPAARAKIYTQIGNIENQQDLAEFMYAKNNFIVATKNVKDAGRPRERRDHLGERLALLGT